MSTLYEFDNYKLTLQALGRRDSYNHEMVRYVFSAPNGDVIFSGDDFGASPLHDTEGEESAKSLLGFLTLKVGDVDEDYFQNYTDKQKEFRDSFKCEQLQIYTLED